MKKILACLFAVIMLVNIAGLSVFAAESKGLQFYIPDKTAKPEQPLVVNQDGDIITRFTVASNDGKAEAEITTPEQCSFYATYYFALDSTLIPEGYLSNSDYFRATFTDKKNFNFLDGSPTLTSKVISGTRYDVIKVKIKDSGKTDEEEISFTMKVKAKKPPKSGTGWVEDDEFSVRFRLFVSSKVDDSGDANVDAGDSVIFKPVKNDLNTIVWGTESYPVASLEFDASSDADDFYAKLSTKANSAIYDDYGNAADAELFFRTFNGDTIDATSRGTLILYNPWYDDGEYDNAPDPQNDVWFYRINGDSLEDITNLFSYVNEDDTSEGVDGWEIRTRVLDSYVISDKPLDSSYIDEELPPIADDELPPPIDDGATAKPLPPDNNTNTGNENIPSTGSYNFVPIAFLACAISLVAVGVIARRKKNKS